MIALKSALERFFAFKTNMIIHQNKQTGFTLIELVMVIVIIGILSYGATSLYSSRDTYAGFIAKDQLISNGLLAQQVALGMSGVATIVTLEVAQGIDPVDSKEKWIFTLMKGAEAKVSMQETSGGSLIIDGTTISTGSSQTFTWNTDGNLTDGANHAISFVNDNTYRVCISSSGYTYFSTTVCPP